MCVVRADHAGVSSLSSWDRRICPWGVARRAGEKMDRLKKDLQFVALLVVVRARMQMVLS